MDLEGVKKELERSKDLFLRLSEDLYRKGDLKGMSSVKALSDDLDMFLSELQYTNVDVSESFINPLLYRAQDINKAVRYVISGREKGLGANEELADIRMGFLSLQDAVNDMKAGSHPKLRDVNPRSILGRTVKASNDGRRQKYFAQKLSAKKAQITKYMKYYQSKGFDTLRLAQAVKLNNIEQINSEYDRYYKDVQKLEELRDKLEEMKKKMKKKGHEREYEKFLELSANPDDVENLTGMLDYFREKVDDDRFASDTSDWIKNYYKRKEKEAEKAAKSGGGSKGGFSIPSTASQSQGMSIPSSKQEFSIPTGPSAAPPSAPPSGVPTPPVVAPPAGVPLPPAVAPPAGAPTPPTVTPPAGAPTPPTITPPAGAPTPPVVAPPTGAPTPPVAAPYPPAAPAPAYAQPPAAPVAPPSSGGGGYQGRSLEELAENGTSDEWFYLFNIVIRNEVKIELPPADPDKGKFPDYGYKNLVKLLLSNKDATRMVTEERDISGYKMIELSTYLRGDENTTRGLAALGNLVLLNEVTYDPTMETEFKYLNILLDCGAPMDKEGKVRTWAISTPAGDKKVTAEIVDGEWIYKVN